MPKSRRQKKRQRREARRKAKRKEIQRAKARSQSRSIKSQLHDALDWPVMECWVSAGWEDPMQLNQVVVARRNPDTGEGWAAMILLDRACLGVKNANIGDFATAREFRREILGMMRETQEMVQIDFDLAAAIVQAGVDYAESLGFKPHSDYKLASILLRDADLEAVDEEIAVGGVDGKPMFVAGPYDNVDKIMTQLIERLGEGNFQFLMPMGGDPFDDLEDDADFFLETLDDEEDDVLSLFEERYDDED